MLIAQGGSTGGYAFFVKVEKLHFVHNHLGRDVYTVTPDVDIPAGDVELRYEFEPTGKPDLSVGKGSPGRGQLYIADTLVGEVDMPHTVPIMFGTEGLTCGRDGGSRVAPDAYGDDFAFTGTLKRGP